MCDFGISWSYLSLLRYNMVTFHFLYEGNTSYELVESNHIQNILTYFMKGGIRLQHASP